MADVKEKLAELIAKAKRSMWGKSGLSSELARNMYLAETLIAHGVRLEEKQATSEESKRFAKDTNVLTNADRIRSMTDDELAEFLCEVNGCYTENCPGAELCKFGGGLANGLKKWLQQPVEVT